MKKLRLASVIFCFCIAKVFSQCPSNGTHTDPTPGLSPSQGGATPTTGDFKQNTFDWTTLGWVDYLKINNVLQGGSIGNPFYSANSHAPFASDANSDFQPTNGWELIKQDMGYFFSGGKWNGDPMGVIPVPYAGDPRLDASKLNYVLLYNKYSGLLRVMVSIPNSDPVHINTIYVKLAFLDGATDYANTPSYQPNVNALFDHYTPISGLALDQKTKVTVVSAPAKFPSTSDMIYCDFQLAYDPCVCLFQSGLEVSFYSIQTANLKLSGTYAGTAIPLAAVSTADQGTIYGAQTGDKFVASVFETGNSPQSAMLSYADASQIVSTDASEKQSLDDLSFGLSLASSILDATSAIPVYGVIGDVLSKATDAGSKIADYYSAKASPSDEVKAAASITLESGYLKATGTITYDPTTYEDINLRIGVPGSKDANTLPEYAPAANGGETLPNYPMYNEPLGTFNLLKTPEVDQYSYIPPLIAGTTVYGTPEVYSQVTGTLGSQLSGILFKYHPSSDLVYVLNPLWDPSNSIINIAYEIEGEPGPFITSAGYYGFGKEDVAGLDFLNPNTANTIAVGEFQKYRTKTFPIGCNQSIYTSENYDYGNFNTGNTSDPNYYNYVSSPRRVTLVVMLALASYPDVYGKVHFTAQIIKYNCKVNQVSTDFEATGNGAAAIAAIANIPTDLTIPQTTYSSPTNTFSFGKITITGNQTDNAPNNGEVDIVAEKEIDITGNVALTGGDIHLYTQELPNNFTACSAVNIPPVTGANITSFCTTGYNGNQYMANQSARTTASNNHKPAPIQKNTTIATKLGINVKAGIYPNPTTGNLYVNIEAQNSGGMMLQISDMNGRLLLRQNYNAETGVNSYKVDMTGFEPGVYFVNITDVDGAPIKQDKLILTK